MPNTIEKPMGRLTLPHYGGNGHYMKCSEQFGCSGECADCEELEKIVERLAYYEDMIANGVTVQKWIPVTERLPEYGKVVLAFGKKHATSGQFRGTSPTKPNWWHWKGNMYKEVSHWMPLPEPPKGE